MHQSEREVLVGESPDQPFNHQRSAEHVGGCGQYSTAYSDDVVASVHSFLTAVGNVANDEYQVEDKSNHRIHQNQHNAHQSVCQNLLYDCLAFLVISLLCFIEDYCVE